MKTEQEQIEVIKKIIDERVETTLGQVQGRHDNVIKTVDTIIIARDIVEAGYGKVSEYEAEIKQLKAKNKVLGDGVAKAFTNGFNTGRKQVEKDIRRAQIDVLNKVMNYINNKIEDDYGDMSDSVQYLTINIDDFDDFIDELIKEIE